MDVFLFFIMFVSIPLMVIFALTMMAYQEYPSYEKQSVCKDCGKINTHNKYLNYICKHCGTANLKFKDFY